MPLSLQEISIPGTNPIPSSSAAIRPSVHPSAVS